MDHKKIRLFTPTFDIENCLSEIRECLELGWTGSGFKTDEFEAAWEKETQLQNSLFLSSNSAGLLIALEALRIQRNWDDGDEVITTALTFVSTNHAILQTGLTPVFCDIDESLNLDPEKVRAAITNKTRAVMFVGIGGNAANYKEIKAICLEFKIALVLDAAHMVGTRNNIGYVGHDADFAIFSFQAVKNLPTADSGMLNTPDAELASIARKLSWLGISTSTYERNSSKGSYKWEYDVDYVGFKANGNSIMAAIALTQLKRIESDNEARRNICEQYSKSLKDLSDIRIVDHDEKEFMSSRHLFQIRVLKNQRNTFVNSLNEQGIDVGVHYRLNTRYKPYLKYPADLPNATEYESQLVSLPLHLRLSTEDLERVISAIKSTIGK
jgi:dTDP-4-amino-4,6-dideoxygalactose transaminase